MRQGNFSNLSVYLLSAAWCALLPQSGTFYLGDLNACGMYNRLKLIALLLLLVASVRTSAGANGGDLQNSMDALSLNAYADQAASDYNPQNVDWRAVVEACKFLASYEKRLASFMIRAGFHDAMAIDTDCAKKASKPITCGGADGSALLTDQEQKRNENQHRSYLKRAAKAIIPIAKKFGASVADTVAVCGMAVTERLGAPNLLDLAPLKVGRRDVAVPNPAGKLLAAEADAAQFEAFWTARNMTLDDGIALIGIHAIMENKGCMLAGTTTNSTSNTGRKLQNTYDKGSTVKTCNPYGDGVTDPEGKTPLTGSCPGLQMHKLDNQYYVDICTPAVSMSSFEQEVGLKDLNTSEYKETLQDITCSFTSDQFRKVALKEAADERSGDIEHWPDGGWLTHNTTGVDWSTKNCKSLAKGITKNNCGHMLTWPYTRLDGYLAVTCQNPKSVGNARLANKIARIAKGYMSNQQKWFTDYAKAYSKMMSMVADWSPQAYYPSFQECSAQLVKAGTNDASHCSACSKPAGIVTDEAKAIEALKQRQSRRNRCPADCVCANSFSPTTDIDIKAVSCGVVCVN